VKPGVNPRAGTVRYRDEDGYIADFPKTIGKPGEGDAIGDSAMNRLYAEFLAENPGIIEYFKEMGK